MLADYRERFSTIEQYRSFLTNQLPILPNHPRITRLHAIIIPIIGMIANIPTHKPLSGQHTNPIPDTRKLTNPPFNTTRRAEHIQIHWNQPVFITRALIIIHILNTKIHDKLFSDSKLITPLFQLKFNTLFQHNKIIQHIIILSSQHITTFTTNLGIFQIKIKLLKLAFQFQKLSKQPLKRIIRHTIASFPWPIRESNPARTLYKSVALTTELIGQSHRYRRSAVYLRFIYFNYSGGKYHYITNTTCSKNEPRTIPPIINNQNRIKPPTINNHNRITLTHSQTNSNLSRNLSISFFIIPPFIPPHTLNIIRIMSHTEIITIITTIKPPMITTMSTTPHTLAQRSTNIITKITLSTHKSTILTLSIKSLLISLKSVSYRFRINIRV